MDPQEALLSGGSSTRVKLECTRQSKDLIAFHWGYVTTGNLVGMKLSSLFLSNTGAMNGV